MPFKCNLCAQVVEKLVIKGAVTKTHSWPHKGIDGGPACEGTLQKQEAVVVVAPKKVVGGGAAAAVMGVSETKTKPGSAVSGAGGREFTSAALHRWNGHRWTEAPLDPTKGSKQSGHAERQIFASYQETKTYKEDSKGKAAMWVAIVINAFPCTTPEPGQSESCKDFFKRQSSNDGVNFVFRVTSNHGQYMTGWMDWIKENAVAGPPSTLYCLEGEWTGEATGKEGDPKGAPT